MDEFRTTNLEVNQLAKNSESVAKMIAEWGMRDHVEYFLLKFEYPFPPELKSIATMKMGEFFNELMQADTTLLEIVVHPDTYV